jgi:hypothetical protein
VTLSTSNSLKNRPPGQPRPAACLIFYNAGSVNKIVSPTTGAARYWARQRQIDEPNEAETALCFRE